MGHTIIAALMSFALSAPSFPAFKLEDMRNGTVVDSAATKHPMLIEFYYNTCPACNTNAQYVEKVGIEFTNKVLTVDFGYDCKKTSYDAWIARHRPSHPVLNGCNSPIFDDLDIGAYPTTVIVDKNKNIVFKTIGTWSNTEMNAIRQKLRSLTQ